MQLLSSHEFHFVTSADADAVWPILIDEDRSVRYLHGLLLKADWEVGGAVEVVAHGRSDVTGVETVPGLRGEVLAAEAPHRLSFTLAADAQSPTTYLTWDVQPDASGCRVRLLVDELSADRQRMKPDDADTDARQRWLPVLHAVRDAVRAAASR